MKRDGKSTFVALGESAPNLFLAIKGVEQDNILENLDWTKR